MAVSSVDICNKALNRLGCRIITSLTEQSQEAIRCNLVFSQCREAVLRDYPWGFANMITTLAAISNDTVPGWDYVYAYPSNCVCIRKLFEDATAQNPVAADHDEVLTPTTKVRALVCDITPAYVQYTYSTSDTSLFDPVFVEALALRVAFEVAFALTGNDALVQSTQKEYIIKISEARKLDSDERNVPDNTTTPSIEAR